jgi:hypothetical protein
MPYVVRGLVVMVVVASAGVAWAHSEHEHEHSAGASQEQASSATGTPEQTLTGEVVDVFCYLSHDKKGLGSKHASCAKHCIQNGLPVAIKVGDQLYLASMADHTAANQKFADLAGQQVTVRGKIMERDGQKLISVTEVQKAP